MSDNLPSIIVNEAPAEASAPFGPPLPLPSNDSEMAEMVAAAEFLSRADQRVPENAMLAAELDAMLGEGNPLRVQLDSGGAGDEDGTRRDPLTGRYVPQVPHRAMHAERERRKVAEARAKELETQVTRAQERLNVLNELVVAANQNGQAAPPQHYVPEASPAGWVDPEHDVFSAVKQLQAQNQQLAAAASERKFLDDVRADLIGFTKQYPEFYDAHKHLLQARDRELELLGLNNQQDRVRRLASEERHLMGQALAAGQSPAALLYRLAIERGFQQGKGAGRVNFAPPDPRAVERVQRTQQGMAASATLSGQGGAPGAALSVEQLANLPDHEFEAIVKKVGGLNSPRVRSAFGG